MLHTVVVWFISALFILNIVFIIAANFIRFGFWFKCRKVNKICNNRECPYRHYCEKYKETYYQDEIIALAKLIEMYKHKNP